jgi:hypothetical protein
VLKCVRAYACVCVCAHACACVCAHACACVRAYAFACVRLLHACTCVRALVCVCVRAGLSDGVTCLGRMTGCGRPPTALGARSSRLLWATSTSLSRCAITQAWPHIDTHAYTGRMCAVVRVARCVRRECGVRVGVCSCADGPGVRVRVWLGDTDVEDWVAERDPGEQGPGRPPQLLLFGAGPQVPRLCRHCAAL